jgi:hypothetical protein
MRKLRGLESLPDLGARIVGERGHYRSLAGAGLPQQPHDKRVRLGTLGGVLCARGRRIRQRRRTAPR